MRALVLAAALLAVLAPGAPAAVLAEEDAAELANALAEATAEQKVCYGWSFEVSDQGSGTEDGPEVGSNLGPGVPVDPARPECGRFAVLTGNVTYASELSESEDAAFWTIESNLPDPPTTAQLADLGYGEGDLLGDQNDLAIINATGALPALVAETGIAGAVPFETERRAAGVSGRPTGDQGSDFLRQNGTLLALCALLVVVGLGLLWRARRLAPTRPSRLTEP